MDVKNAFLNGVLEETIYLRALAGLLVPKGKCLLLVKSIYGLKQAPQVWHHELSSFFVSIGFLLSKADPCLFILNHSDWQCWVHVYVDDLVIVSKDVHRFKQLYSAKYLMEDLGPLCHLLGMKIEKVQQFGCPSPYTPIRSWTPMAWDRLALLPPHWSQTHAFFQLQMLSDLTFFGLKSIIEGQLVC
jgi:hypothetical protein